jgi:hypothetical protein
VPNSFEHAIKFVGSAFGNVQNALSDLKLVYLSVPEKTTGEEARGRVDLTEIHMSTGRLGPDTKSRTEFLVAANARELHSLPELTGNTLTHQPPPSRTPLGHQPVRH